MSYKGANSMQYLVQVSGDVLEKQSKSYAVAADSKEAAQEIAAENFRKEFYVGHDEVSVSLNKRTFHALVSFILISVPILLSFIGWKDGHDTIKISPDYVSCFYGVLIYSSFIVRFKGIRRTVGSWIDIGFCILIVLLLSTFIKTILVNKTLSFLGFIDIPISTNALLLIAILLSWFGMKLISLACMGIVVIAALFNISALNQAMGSFFGPMYVICSFVGILFYLSVEPACFDALNQAKKLLYKGGAYLLNDISQGQQQVVKIRSALESKKIGAGEKGDK